jgi:hypothetical protein
VNKPRGRPPLDPDSPSVGASVRLSAREYDALADRARRNGISVAELIRRDLRRPDPGRPAR